MTRVDQQRTNPSQAISNFKGRWDSVFAWPSTAVSTWLNGGLFGDTGISWAYGAGGDTTTSVTTGGFDWRYHIFNSSGTFNPDTSNTTYGGKYPAYIEVFVIGAGGGGGSSNSPSSTGGGGGGAGSAMEFTVLDGNEAGTGMLLANDSDNLTVTVGAGGNGGAYGGVSIVGGDSSVTCSSATPTARRGGGGGTAGQGVYDTAYGGSGGGGSYPDGTSASVDSRGSGGGGGGGTPTVGSLSIHNNGGEGGNHTSYGAALGSPNGGNNGAHGATGDSSGAYSLGGGGGSAGGVPQTGGSCTYSSIGKINTWTGSNVYYACGGAGLAYVGGWGTSDNIGDANWDAVTAQSVAATGATGNANSGSGGGGGNHTNSAHGKGGSGIVIIRYKV